jgi:hypothetical protein
MQSPKEQTKIFKTLYTENLGAIKPKGINKIAKTG